MIGVESSGKGYLCPSCKSRHRPYTDRRIKVVVSDILHEFFAPPGYTRFNYSGDTLHVDYVTIAGATLPDLLHAFRLDYEMIPHTKPLDVVLVAGYSDLEQGFGREFIHQGYKVFTESVMNIGRQRNPDIANTVAVASLMYPPKLSWFSANGPEPYNYHNQISKIDYINHKIHQLNIDNNAKFYPGFHSYGTRKVTDTYTDITGQQQKQHYRSHRWEHWQETLRRDKVTLRLDRKFKMGNALNNYFITRTSF